MPVLRTASFLVIPAVSAYGMATYIRSSVQPAQAHSHLLSLNDSVRDAQWRKINNGLGVDVGRSCGGI
ncbi:hypothetical protein BDF14DRAFT_1766305 [Spinellus fusiger]|nr:hypothetical protein BDF14DRAFT_1766305 [Spinellus fusiger]